MNAAVPSSTPHTRQTLRDLIKHEMLANTKSLYSMKNWISSARRAGRMLYELQAFEGEVSEEDSMRGSSLQAATAMEISQLHSEVYCLVERVERQDWVNAEMKRILVVVRDLVDVKK
ncbi:hypothetical protein N0V82_008461 [Gnomoniopsis sp. IMI 355080]|nr:hypothetical protein N0V82_008461 [Gnomoniopsis sp. IMI 355080]